jgi:multiple antibiotic resistance protein
MSNLLESFVSAIPVAFMALITVINPLGTGFVLSAMTDGIALDQRKKLARTIVINCIGIFLVVLVFGSYILNFFGLNISIIRVGGGLLLAFMGWSMLNAPDATDTTSVGAVDSDTYFKKAFYPFTFPVTSGPGCIAVVFTLVAHHGASEALYAQLAGLSGTLIGLVGVTIVVYLCYVYSYLIQKKLGPDGAHALNRIMAFVTLCIGLQILWAGIQGLAKTLQ